MLHSTFPVDDDPDRNGVVSALGEHRVHPLQDVFIPCMVGHALWDFPPAGAARETGLSRQLHPTHLLTDIFDHFRVAAGKDAERTPRITMSPPPVRPVTSLLPVTYEPPSGCLNCSVVIRH